MKNNLFFYSLFSLLSLQAFCQNSAETNISIPMELYIHDQTELFYPMALSQLIITPTTSINNVTSLRLEFYSSTSGGCTGHQKDFIDLTAQSATLVAGRRYSTTDAGNWVLNGSANPGNRYLQKDIKYTFFISGVASTSYTTCIQGSTLNNNTCTSASNCGWDAQKNWILTP
jgi:hypothetical protein